MVRFGCSLEGKPPEDISGRHGCLLFPHQDLKGRVVVGERRAFDFLTSTSRVIVLLFSVVLSYHTAVLVALVCAKAVVVAVFSCRRDFQRWGFLLVQSLTLLERLRCVLKQPCVDFCGHHNFVTQYKST